MTDAVALAEAQAEARTAQAVAKAKKDAEELFLSTAAEMVATERAEAEVAAQRASTAVAASEEAKSAARAAADRLAAMEDDESAAWRRAGGVAKETLAIMQAQSVGLNELIAACAAVASAQASAAEVLSSSGCASSTWQELVRAHRGTFAEAQDLVLGQTGTMRTASALLGALSLFALVSPPSDLVCYDDHLTGWSAHVQLVCGSLALFVHLSCALAALEFDARVRCCTSKAGLQSALERPSQRCSPVSFGMVEASFLVGALFNLLQIASVIAGLYGCSESLVFLAGSCLCLLAAKANHESTQSACRRSIALGISEGPVWSTSP
eukprot:2727774-Prymnesium_polylepis.2